MLTELCIPVPVTRTDSSISSAFALNMGERRLTVRLLRQDDERSLFFEQLKQFNQKYDVQVLRLVQ